MEYINYETRPENVILFNVKFDLRKHKELIYDLREVEGVEVIYDHDITRYSFRVTHGDLFDPHITALLVMSKIQEYSQKHKEHGNLNH